MDEIRYRRDLWRILLCATIGRDTITNRLAGGVAEVGVAEGNFSRDILHWPVRVPKLYMVDRWRRDAHTKGDSSMPQEWHDRNYEVAMNQTAENLDRRVVLKGESIEMAKQVPDRSLALVYIDADHSFIGVTNDIHAWLPKLIDGGVMAFHDYENINYGVRRAVQLFAEAHGLEVHHIPEDKSEDAGAWFRWHGPSLNENPI